MVTTEDTINEFRELMADPASRQAFVEMKAQHAEQGVSRRYEHVLRVVGSRPWALEESVLAIMVDVLTFRAYGGRMTAEEIEGRIGAARRTTSQEAPRGVARIPVSGVLVPKAGGFNDMSGGSSTEKISGMLHDAVNSPQVGSIVLDVDSPGGMVDGIPELAAEIRAAREIKPVVAVANTEAMSAAYWLASQADRFFASPSARVGSIGVVSTHEDRSAQAEQKGIKTTILSAGKYKAEGNPFEPLSDDAREHLQSMIDDAYSMFVKDVADGRGIETKAVIEGFGQGRFFNASQAESKGMIDGIATIDQVIRGEFANIQSAQTPKAMARDGKPYTVVPFDIDANVYGEKWDRLTGTANDQTDVVTTGSTNDPFGALETPPKDPTPEPDAPAPLPDPVPIPETEPQPGNVTEPGALAPNWAPDPPPAAEEPDPALDQVGIDVSLAAIEEAAGLILAEVDNSAWDGNRAMGQCETAADYSSICAGERSVGEPSERQHWALPHHYLGKGPNADGVRAALSRIGQTENLSNRDAAQRHLDAHMREISPNEANAGRYDSEISALKAELGVLTLPE